MDLSSILTDKKAVQPPSSMNPMGGEEDRAVSRQINFLLRKVQFVFGKFEGNSGKEYR